MRSMENRETILQELKQISEVVASLERKNTFFVPPAYFDGFASSVLARIQAENAVFGSKTTPFSVSEGYFDGLASTVLDRIRQQQVQTVEEERNEIAPILNTISRQPVYTVPDGYFESLEITVPLKVARPAEKVFSLGKSRRILQYAVAACTAGILMVGAYLYTNRGTGTPGETVAISYDSALKMDVSQELAGVNVQEIDQYLNETPVVGYSINTAPDEVDVEQYIQSASDEEIRQYLNETAEPGEQRRDS
jgi:hypothetical protein